MIRSIPSRLATMAVLCTAVAALATGCSSSGNEVDVTLGEFNVDPEPTSVGSGEVKITADNKGALTHELVVVRGEDAASLPTDDNGAVVEDDLPEGALIGEIEDIGSQSTKSTTLDLEPGSYVLFCNIEESGGGATASHFAQGMHAELEVG